MTTVVRRGAQRLDGEGVRDHYLGRAAPPASVAAAAAYPLRDFAFEQVLRLSSQAKRGGVLALTAASTQRGRARHPQAGDPVGTLELAFAGHASVPHVGYVLRRAGTARVPLYDLAVADNRVSAPAPTAPAPAPAAAAAAAAAAVLRGVEGRCVVAWSARVDQALLARLKASQAVRDYLGEARTAPLAPGERKAAPPRLKRKPDADATRDGPARRARTRRPGAARAASAAAAPPTAAAAPAAAHVTHALFPEAEMPPVVRSDSPVF